MHLFYQHFKTLLFYPKFPCHELKILIVIDQISIRPAIRPDFHSVSGVMRTILLSLNRNEIELIYLLEEIKLR